MRALFVFGLYCLLSPAVAAVPDRPPPDEPQALSDQPDLSNPGAPSSQTLDQLFATMAGSADRKTGEAAEVEIERRWLQSGSDTVDLLMGWAQQAIVAKDFNKALDFLDAVIALKPDYAEGWNRRATLFFMQDQYGKALSDIEKVLALEPRHFGALAGLGMMLKEIDRKREALTALRKALAVDPYVNDEVRDTIKELEPVVDGRQI